MDSVTIGGLKFLLEKFGLKATLSLLALGGMVYGLLRAFKFLASFLDRMQESRDKMMAQTMQYIADRDVEVAKVLERINGNQEKTMHEMSETRKEMHQRFNRASEEHTEMKESLAEIKGAQRG